MERTYEDLARRVAAKAYEVADTEGWCTEGVVEALEELGIDRQFWPTREVTVRFTVTDRERLRDAVDSFAYHEDYVLNWEIVDG